MNRKQFLSTLAVASTALVLGEVATAEIKEEPTAYTITETDEYFIISGTMKETTLDCRGKGFYLKGHCDIMQCEFINVNHWGYDFHTGSRFEYNTITFVGADTKSIA